MKEEGLMLLKKNSLYLPLKPEKVSEAPATGTAITRRTDKRHGGAILEGCL